MDKEQAWYVYLVRTRLDTLYCGVTTDVNRRFHQHSNTKAGAKALKGKGPLTLAWQSLALSKQEAMQMEYRIKQMPKSRKEAMIIESRRLGL